MASAVRRLGRYALHRQIAAGGMASVHLGRLIGPAGFSRTVAIKRLHPQLAQDASFVAMFLDEARVTGRIVHPNIVSTIDVVQERGELFIVMDFVEGAALSSLFNVSVERGQPIEPAIAAGIVLNALSGLHAAHEAVGEGRRPLEVIHRDVSPHNILVGTDGIARIADFGIAKAVGRMQSTTQGQLKGKLSYMAPEVIRGEEIDRRVDVYGAAVVLWELLVGDRLFKGNEASILYDALEAEIEPPSRLRPELPSAIDDVVLKGLAKKRDDRFATAAEFADALEQALSPASARRVGAWVQSLASTDLKTRAALIEELERTADDAPPVSNTRVPDEALVEGRPIAKALSSEPTGPETPPSGDPASSARSLPDPISSPAPTEHDDADAPRALRAPPRTRAPWRRLAWPVAGLSLGVTAAVGAFVVARPAPEPAAASSDPLATGGPRVGGGRAEAASSSSVPASSTTALAAPSASSVASAAEPPSVRSSAASSSAASSSVAPPSGAVLASSAAPRPPASPPTGPPRPSPSSTVTAAPTVPPTAEKPVL